VSRNRNSRSGTAASLFHLNRAARIPAHVQLEEQVKVALALGKLRPGDPLPSIRKVEEDLGVGRMLVRKAYQHLQHAGLVRVVHGRGAVVTGQAHASGRVRDKAEALITRLIADLRRERLDPVTFARILQQRLIAEDARAPRILYVDPSEVRAKELGEQIQQAFGVHVRAIGLQRLRRSRSGIGRDVHVLVGYYYLADVRKVLGRRSGGIHPLSWDHDVGFIERLRNLPLGSPVMLLFSEKNLKEQGTLLAIDALIDRVKEREFKVDVTALENAGPLSKLPRSRYAAVIVSSRVWDDHADVLERYPETFWRLRSRINHQSLDAIRDRLGFVL
jgi:DNA-binding transcriptional regulator YhcF (GntR family)